MPNFELGIYTPIIICIYYSSDSFILNKVICLKATSTIVLSLVFGFLSISSAIGLGLFFSLELCSSWPVSLQVLRYPGAALLSLYYRIRVPVGSI